MTVSVALRPAWHEVAVCCSERIAASIPYELSGAFGPPPSRCDTESAGRERPPVDGDGDAFVVKEGGRSRPESLLGRLRWRQSAPPMPGSDRGECVVKYSVRIVCSSVKPAVVAPFGQCGTPLDAILGRTHTPGSRSPTCSPLCPQLMHRQAASGVGQCRSRQPASAQRSLARKRHCNSPEPTISL